MKKINYEWNINASTSIETEAVLIKIKMDNKWNIIFYKIWGTLKNYQDWGCISQDRNE